MKKIQRNLIGILLICLMLAGLLTALPLGVSAETVTEKSERIYGYTYEGCCAVTLDLPVTCTKVRVICSYSRGLTEVWMTKSGYGRIYPDQTYSGQGNYTYDYDKELFFYDLEPGEYNIWVAPPVSTPGTSYMVQIVLTYEVHTHNYSYSTKKVAPTCTARGYMKHTCSCGDYYTDNYVDKLPHTEVYAPREAPTCTKTGKDEGTKCSVCGTTISGRTEIPKLPHDTAVEIPRVEPTCTTLGKTTGAKCSVCGTISIAQENIPKLPHDTAVEIPRVEPTCTTLGKATGAKCSVCGTVSVAQEDIPMLPHDTAVEIPRVEPTCTTLGKTTGAKCSVCGTVSHPQEDIPKLPHTEVSSPDVAVTCTTDGKTDVKFCTVCEQEVSCTVIPKLGHNFVEYFCTRCGCVDSSSVIDYGQCGDNAKWLLTKSGTLTISGTGAMKDYEYGEAPWRPYGATYTNNYIKSIVVENGITHIGDYTFGSCWLLKKVTMPSSVTSIGYRAFADCSVLEAITIPSSVTKIGSQAFSSCRRLETITIPSSVKTIGSNTFDSCTSLETITIPSSVTIIGYQAFARCSSLRTITIPSSVTTIRDRAFDECESLTRITFEGSAPTFESAVFRKVRATAYYHSSDPTWTSSVRKDYIGKITWKAIERCSHKAVTDPAVEATCTNSGLTEGSHCSVCGTALVKQEKTPVTSHRYEYAVDMEPTITVAGTLAGTCTTCGDDIAVELPILSEEAYDYVVTAEPTYTETGLAAYTWKETAYGTYTFEVVLEKLPILYGDVNGDGTVNNKDRLVLTRYLAKWTDYPAEVINMAAADVNADGTVNNKDRLILTRHLAKWTGYEELPYKQ